MQRIDSLGNKAWGDTGSIVAWYPELPNSTVAWDIVRDPVNDYYYCLFANPNNNEDNDLYCQKLDSDGNPLWQENGMMVADSFSHGLFNNYAVNYLAPDLSGGVYVTWRTDIPYVGWHNFMQHLDAGGNIL